MAFEKPVFAFKDESVLFNEPMKRHTTLGVGGNAKYFIKVKSLLGILRAIEFSENLGLPFKVIGNGSNLLVSDNGYDGVIISVKGLCKIEEEIKCGAVFLTVGGGTSLFALSAYCAKNGLSGMEGLFGIPGTVGGAVKMNAGAFGYCIGEVAEEVTLLSDGKIKTLCKHDCGFSYRSSAFLEKDVITSVKLKLKPEEKTVVKSRRDCFYEIRSETQPKGKTCGSIFKNPEGLYAGLLIETAGLKGKKNGGAEISEKHANFIRNVKNATACDVKGLIDYVKDAVYKKFNVALKEEVELLGEF